MNHSKDFLYQNIILSVCEAKLFDLLKSVCWDKTKGHRSPKWKLNWAQHMLMLLFQTPALLYCLILYVHVLYHWLSTKECQIESSGSKHQLEHIVALHVTSTLKSDALSLLCTWRLYCHVHAQACIVTVLLGWTVQVPYLCVCRGNMHLCAWDKPWHLQCFLYMDLIVPVVLH